MRAGRLEDALDRLHQALGEVEAILKEMRADRDPLALCIFNARRNHRKMENDTKSGARRETAALVSFKQAAELGFPGTLGDWQRLLAAVRCQ